MRNERKDNSLIAFKDNSSVIRGSKSNQFTFKYPNKIYEIDKKTVIMF